MRLTVDIVIASYNMKKTITETLFNCLYQDYPKLNIIVYDDASTDGTKDIFDHLYYNKIKYFRGKKNLGVGKAFEAGCNQSSSDIVILMCADDVFTDERVVSDIVKVFDERIVGHVSRYYHQFVGNDRRPVRAWRTQDPIVQANNPSGLAFRRKAIEGKSFSNEMFIEASDMVAQVIKKWDYRILPYDAVAVRIHNSTSTLKDTYLKYWTRSPLENWVRIGGRGMLSDFTSLIQIKKGYRTSAVLKEAWMFIKLRPMNIFNPFFWLFSLLTLLTPRSILNVLPVLYRKHIGGYITGAVKRP